MAFYKMILLRCRTQYASKFGNLSSGQRTRRGQFSFQSQRRAIALIAHGNMVMLKILQVRLQQYVNWELPMVQAGVSKRQRNKRSNRHHSLDNRLTRDSRKPTNKQTNKKTCFIDYAQAFDCVDHNRLWKILPERDGNTRLLTCLLRNLYVSQEAPVKIEHGITDWFKIGKGVHKGCILSPCLFNFYAKCMCSKSSHSCLTLCDPMDCNLPGSSVHRILQARIPEWVATTSSRGSSWPRDRTCISCVSCIGRQILYH